MIVIPESQASKNNLQSQIYQSKLMLILTFADTSHTNNTTE
jgi:hypothetical protein